MRMRSMSKHKTSHSPMVRACTCDHDDGTTHTMRMIKVLRSTKCPIPRSLCAHTSFFPRKKHTALASLKSTYGECALIAARPSVCVYMCGCIVWLRLLCLAGPCDALKFSFGGGSEMSSTHVSLPEPYAYVLRGDEYFGLNLHLIDLRGVPEADVQSCVQCECAYLNEIKHGEYDESSNKYPAEGGGAQCCFGGMQCESSLPDEDLAQYYFKYEIKYEAFDASKHVPVYTSVLSASSDSARACHVEFNPPVCSDGDHGEGPESDHTFGSCIDEDTAVTEFKWQVNSDINAIWSFGHVHIGSLDGVHTRIVEPVVSTEKSSIDGKDVTYMIERDLCISEPFYGEPGSVEDSFVAGIVTCDHMNGNEPTRIPKGSVISVRGRYNGKHDAAFYPEYVDESDPLGSNEVKFGAPYHGSMVYFTLFYTFADPQTGYSQFGDVISA